MVERFFCGNPLPRKSQGVPGDMKPGEIISMDIKEITF